MRRSRNMLRTLSARTTMGQDLARIEGWGEKQSHTLILANVFQSKSQAGILAFDDAHLAKGALADDSEEFEVVQLNWCFVWSVAEAAGASNVVSGKRGGVPSSVKTTGLPCEFPMRVKPSGARGGL